MSGANRSDEDPDLEALEEATRLAEHDPRAPDPGPPMIGRSLERLLHNLGAPPVSVLTQLEAQWPDIVGPGLSASTRPVELVNGVLTIACDDAAWASQVGWMEAQIMERLTAGFGPNLLRRIATRVSR